MEDQYPSLWHLEVAQHLPRSYFAILIVHIIKLTMLLYSMHMTSIVWSVHAGRGIPPKFLFMRYLPFLLLITFFEEIFLFRPEDLRTEVVVYCTGCNLPLGKFGIFDIGLYKYN